MKLVLFLSLFAICASQAVFAETEEVAPVAEVVAVVEEEAAPAVETEAATEEASESAE